VLCVRGRADVPLPNTIRAQAEAFIAGWNRRMRWPKAYLVDDDKRGRGFWIMGENCFSLEPGIHQALLEHLIDVSMAAGRQLLRQYTAALAGVDELDTWLREAG
jgi:hypothetical protein